MLKELKSKISSGKNQSQEEKSQQQNQNLSINQIVPQQEIQDPAQQEISNEKKKEKSMFNVFANEVQIKFDEGKKIIKDTQIKLDKATQNALAPYKEKINIYIQSKVEEQVIKTLERLRPHVKSAIKDPNMFKCEQRWVDEIVDQNWPDLVEEARFRLKMATQKPFQQYEKKKRLCILRPIYWIRAKYLYAMMPYDQSFFKQRKNVFFWLFVILSAFPYWGVQPCWYFIVFCFIDKSDEFQLVKYILNFKKMQFITQGLIQGAIGYIKYFACASMYDEDEAYSIAAKCIDEGPGSEMNFYYDLVTYSLQIVLIWMAFLRLPCSVQKGAPKFRYETVKKQDQIKINLAEEQSKQKYCQVNCKRGGILQSMLIWDVFSFCIATLVFIVTFKSQPYDLSWSDSTPYLFFAKFIYGLLSLPFLLFAIPVITNLLTRSKATAYDQFGNCVPHNKSIDLHYTVPEDEIYLSQTKIDITQIVEQSQTNIEITPI